MKTYKLKALQAEIICDICIRLEARMEDYKDNIERYQKEIEENGVDCWRTDQIEEMKERISVTQSIIEKLEKI